jgi:hypothetical protein
MIPARNVTDAHAQDLRANDQLLLSSLQAFVQNTSLLHSTGKDCVISLHVVGELSVALTNSSLVPYTVNPPTHHATHHTASYGIRAQRKKQDFKICTHY